MKKIFISIAAVALMMLSACGGSKTNEGNTESAEVEATETEAAEEQALVVPEDPDPERGEVWTSLGGCYFFYNGEESAVVNVALSEDEPSTFNYGEQEYRATIDETTGQILAYDGDKLVFCGYVYDGGNSLGGNYQGQRIFLQGVGD